MNKIKLYNKGADLSPRVLGGIKERDWLNFLMDRDGFGINMPITIEDNGYEIKVTQDREYVVSDKQKVGYSYSQFQFYRKGGKK